MKNYTRKTTIFQAIKEDLSTILELQKVCYQENAQRYNNPDIPPVRQTLDEISREFQRSLFFKAVQDEMIVGSIRGYLDGNTCYICRLFVHPHYQNRGIGKKLLKAIEQHFKSAQRFELFTGYKDDKNIALYIKAGYRKIREEERAHDRMLFFFMEKLRIDLHQ